MQNNKIKEITGVGILSAIVVVLQILACRWLVILPEWQFLF